MPVAQAEVPEAGLRVDLVADERVRAGIAQLAGLVALPRFDAGFDLTRHGRGGLHVIGRISATVGQICGVTLEPIKNEVDEAVDLVFVPSASQPAGEHEGNEVEISGADAPEELVDGVVDLGALATEFLIVGITPYPRKPGSVFQAPNLGEDLAQPFAALAALKKAPRRQER
jgi:Large ribosomal RNA subunit accumulation protein YceD